MPSRSPATISAALLHGAIEVAAEHGLPRDDLHAWLGVAADADLQFDRRLLIDDVNAFWGRVMRRVREPALPLLTAGRLRTEQMHVLGFALLTSPTAREASLRVMRFGNLLTDSGTWSLEERGDEAIIRWDNDQPPELGVRVGDEAALTAFWISSCQVMQLEYGPVRVFFRHPAPRPAPHADFFRCPVQFGAGSTGLVLRRELLEIVPRQANPTMAAFFDGEMQKRLGGLQASGEAAPLADRVAAAVRGELASGEPSMSTICRRLGMSERSLRRYLADEGTGFRERVDRLRRDEAARLLGDASMSLSEVAFLLGFSDSSAFSRAFKRWFGVPPGEYRRQP